MRMAVGAQLWQVSWMFLRRALVQLGISLAVGLPAALALGRLARFLRQRRWALGELAGCGGKTKVGLPTEARSAKPASEGWWTRPGSNR